MAKMPKAFEKKDKAADKKAGIKENSKRDEKADAKGLKAFKAKGKKK